MSESSGRVRRLGRPSWLDPRLILGILLVLAAVVVGARLFASADNFSRLYVAAHPLVPGEHLTAADLSVGRARFDGQGSDYLSADAAPPVGYVVQRYIGAGEFVPFHAIAPSGVAAGDRLVTLPVQPGHLPPDVGPGSLVDIYASAKSGANGGSSGGPRLVASSLSVQSRAGGAGALSPTTVLSLVVVVPDGEVSAVVHAVESGLIDVVALPPTAAGVVHSGGSP